MILIQGQWIGVDGLTEEELRKLRPSAERTVLKAALHYESSIKAKLSGDRHGRIYVIGKRGRLHQASAPGEPPAVLFGKLRQSITHSRPEWEGDTVSVEVGTKIVYAAILEWGGVAGGGSRILPRPYFAPTFLEQQDRMEAILEEAGAGT